jgi:hypothetical protein
MGAAEIISFEEVRARNNGTPFANSSTSALTNGSMIRLLLKRLA